ncbi:TPA: acylneuraminate cytidylyltransferase family protein [Campylobacter jejuni]|nr:acylneuraminate cytidylyltransferase family protein [Campylobacter jejuni]
MKINALLPMKGHSERIKNKNMKQFDGFPLYHAVMKVLLESSYIDKIFINTDSNIIASDVDKNFNHGKVIIIKRPAEIQGDFVSMNDIIAYDLTQCNGEYFLQTHSTNPLLKTSTIDLAIKMFFDNLELYDSLFSVTKVQARFYDKNAKSINHNPEELLRTQDLEPIYEENSNFYIFSRNSFSLAGKKRIGLKPQIFSMNKLEAIDIDNPEDFTLAELLYKNKDIII